MSTIAILQASTLSRRFPRKVLQRIGGQPMVLLAASRILQCPLLDQLVVSVPLEPGDNGLAALLQQAGLSVTRAVCKSETYDLGPFLHGFAAHDLVLRLTADCPFADPILIARLVEAAQAAQRANTFTGLLATRSDRRFFLGEHPPGFDVECFSVGRLRECEGSMNVVWARHPTGNAPFLPATPACYPGLSVTVDFVHDLDWVRSIWDLLGGQVDYQTICRWWNGKGRVHRVTRRQEES